MSTTIHWQKSSFSGGGPDNDCVEVGASRTAVHIRESDHPDAVLTTTRPRLRAFILAVKAGTYDHGTGGPLSPAGPLPCGRRPACRA
jgi:hypothetical protein